MSKYGLIASVGLAIDFGLVIFTKEVLGFYYILSVSIGFLFGLIVTYLLSNKYVFGEPKSSQKNLFLFFGVIGLIGLVILNILVLFFTEILHFNYILSKVVATIGVFMWNFFARKSLYHD